MSGETFLTVVGNLTADPELRFTQSGAPVCNFSVASTPRNFNPTIQQWEDGETLFMRVTVWRDMAENCAETLLKGMRVIVRGRLEQKSFEDREGNKRISMDLIADEVGPSLKFASGDIVRNVSSNADKVVPIETVRAKPRPTSRRTPVQK